MCDCLFDFVVDIPVGDFDGISLRIVRDSSDDDREPDVAFDGVVDISSGSAEVVIYPAVGMCYY
jgi:hypothetical protein